MAVNTDGSFWLESMLNTNNVIYGSSTSLPDLSSKAILESVKKLVANAVDKSPLSEKEITEAYAALITNGNLWRNVVLDRVAKDFAGADVAVTVRLTDAQDAPQLTTQYYGWRLKQLSYVFVPQDTMMVGAFLSMDFGMAVRLFKAMDRLSLTAAELKTLALDYIKAQPPETFRRPMHYSQLVETNSAGAGIGRYGEAFLPGAEPIPDPYVNSGMITAPTLGGAVLTATTYTLATSINTSEE